MNGTPADGHPHSWLQAGLDHIDQGISVFDRSLRLVGWNRRFVELIDIPPAMVRVGTPFENFIRYNAERGEYGPGSVDDLVAERVRLARTFVRHDFERVRPNGVVLSVQGAPLADGGFVTVYTDVTQRRRAEALIREHSEELEARVRQRTGELCGVNAELRESIARLQEITLALQKSEERLRLITDAIPASIAYVDKDMTIRFANRRFAELFARTSEAIVGWSLKEVCGTRLFTALRPHLAPAFAGRTADFEYTYSGPDGDVITHTALIPELADDGRVLGSFVLSLDVTAAKKAEAALRDAQKMAAIGQLAGGLAHDFNNLLTVVVGNLRSLKGAVDADLAEEYIEPAIRAGHRGVDITRRLLAFARRQPLEPLAVDVQQIISRTVALLRMSLSRSIAISCESDDGEPWPALADPNQLESALVNLALNARDAMPNGGSLTFRVANRTLAEGTVFAGHAVGGAYVQIDVADTGIGIDAGTASRAFEPFFTTKPFGLGSGLGLSMVYGFVKQSGGHIRIASELRKGTCVSFLLPRAEGPAPLDGPTEDRPRGRGDRELVLLVEDSDAVRLVIRRELLELGYHVIEARDGLEAEGLLQSVSDIGVLVSDVVMPGGVSGRALALMARHMRPDIRIVLISGFEHAEDGEEPALAGVAWLGKPFEREQLRRAIGG
jgi:PAS domain S-box-containing protein